MTKRELMAMIENFNDDDEMVFVTKTVDRDGYPEDRDVNVYKVVKKGTEKVRQMYV